ncbi:MAG: hypothetical protein M3Q69_01805 [Acidobacteriota bacterium]|nr:hypothetical protein [Acidobacteriota bacterium]
MFPTVLVVESYADLRAGIVSALQHHAYSCDAVGSVAAAEEKLRERDYAYVVVDVDADASDTLVSSFDPDAHVILISDADPRDERSNQFAMLRKPFSRDQLLAQFAR